MKKVMLIWVIAAAMLVQGCTNENDDWKELGNNVPPTGTEGGASSGSGAAADLDVTDFTVNINREALAEQDNVDLADEDYIEYSGNDFTTEVAIAFDGKNATYTGADGVSIVNDGADVVVTSQAKGVSYTISGSTTDGSLKIYSEKKFKLVLNGVSITNKRGAAINIQSKKRCYAVLADGTTSVLADGTSYTATTDGEDMKGCLFSEGKLLFSGKGSLEVYGNTKNGIATDDYLVTRPGTNIYVKSTTNHGIKTNDGVDIKGGVVNIEVQAEGAKGINTEGFVRIRGGRTTIIASGAGYYDTDEREAKGAACIKADSTFVMTGGELWLKATGSGGKGINSDMQIAFEGGSAHILTTGTRFSNTGDTASPKGIKADEDITISGGTVVVRVEGKSEGAEGIESKSTFNMTGGTVEVYSYDDAINSKYDMTIAGGYLWARALNNDALDANRNLYINGGNIVAIGSSTPENALDAAEGYSIFINGGNLFAIGGSTAQTSASSKQASVAFTATGLGGSTLGLTDADGSSLMYIEIPSTSCSAVQMSVDGMKAGSTFQVKSGVSVSGGTTWGGLNTSGEFTGGSALCSVTSALQVGTGMGGGMPGKGGWPGGR